MIRRTAYWFLIRAAHRVGNVVSGLDNGSARLIAENGFALSCVIVVVHLTLWLPLLLVFRILVWAMLIAAAGIPLDERIALGGGEVS